MIYHNEDPNVFAEKYKIDMSPINCPKCEFKINFINPLSFKGYRGIMAEKCASCNYESRIVRIVPVGDKTNFWNKVATFTGIKKLLIHW